MRHDRPMDPVLTEAVDVDLDRLHAVVGAARAAMSTVVEGKEEAVATTLTVLLAGGQHAQHRERAPHALGAGGRGGALVSRRRDPAHASPPWASAACPAA